MKFAHHQLLVQRKVKMTEATRLAIHYGQARRDVLLLGQASRFARTAKLSALEVSVIVVTRVLRLLEEALLVSILPE